MAGMGIGATSPCCGGFSCACVRGTWPATLYLTDPVGTIELAKTSDATFAATTTAYRFSGTRSASAYEYCSSPSLGTFDIPFTYNLTCYGGVLALQVLYFLCVDSDAYGHGPFSIGYPQSPSNCSYDGVDPCFSAPSPLVTEPGSLVRNRTAYIHHNDGTCETSTQVVESTAGHPPFYGTVVGGLGCYSVVSDGVGVDRAGTDVGLSAQRPVGAISPQPTVCSAIVDLSLTMSIPDNFTGGTVTITS